MLIDLTSLTEEELESLRIKIETEKFNRIDVRKQKLIEDFRKAFNALRKEGYDVWYCLSDYDSELYPSDEVHCDNWQNFDFY